MTVQNNMKQNKTKQTFSPFTALPGKNNFVPQLWNQPILK